MGYDAHRWPVEKSDYSGYQHPLEYFTFREKFMFLALEGLTRIAWPEQLAAGTDEGESRPRQSTGD
ncbi:type VI secretion protein [Yersinia pseudotuberculosis]|nr:type VI secretion protein [Yersinia pseudotuberculosis]